MKPFNLENFLEGEPAITRDGRKVIDWHYFKDAEEGARLFVLIEGRHKSPIPYQISGTTKFYQSSYDLFMEEKEVDLWINVYKMDSEFYLVGKYDTEGEALVWATVNHEKGKKFISTHKITIKE